MKFYLYLREDNNIDDSSLKLEDPIKILRENNKLKYDIRKSSSGWQIYQKSPIKRLVQTYKKKKDALKKLNKLMDNKLEEAPKIG